MKILLLTLLFLFLSTSFLVWTDTGTTPKVRIKKPKKKSTNPAQILNQKRQLLIQQVQIPLPTYYFFTAMGAICGAVLGKVLFHEVLFSLVVAILGAVAPLLLLHTRMIAARTGRIEKLRSSMMLLSNSYLITEDFLKTTEDNLMLLEYPEPFKAFLAYISYIDSNTANGLNHMAKQVNNDYFSQWIHVLILAQNDRGLKYVTLSVVDEMNDMAQAQREVDTAIYAVWREYFTVLILIFSAPLIFRVLMPDAYVILVESVIGQGLLFLLLVSVVYSVVKALKLNKPLLM